MDDKKRFEDCPFLKEKKVVYCKAYPLKKMLPLDRLFEDENLCFNKSYRTCPIYQKHAPETMTEMSICYFLGTENMLYCDLSPVKKYVPVYSLKLLNPCSSNAYRDCRYYKEFKEADTDTEKVQGFIMEREAYYCSNHLWIKRSFDGIKIGIDDFGQFIMGPIKEVLLPEKGRWNHPKNVFVTLKTDDGVVILDFPVKGYINNVNDAVSSNGTLINLDPYGDGWLVEMVPYSGFKSIENNESIFYGEKAKAWLEQEAFKLRHFIESEIGVTVADGGEIWRGLRDALGIKGNLLIKMFFS
ncbi:MAG: glycine cleavage system protein H [Syntrophorhabdaceae bacterium]|nr:glycine cleavage system protein H [Syntrophorhabdaceae bacterium]